MIEETKQEILSHARETFPKECCGLICVENGKEVYRRCKNLSRHDRQFIMDHHDYAAAHNSGTITRIVHSHCNEPAKPSQSDLVACEASGIPWIIVSLPNETWDTLKPTGYKAPLIGRQFHHGVLDCYSLIRDWYLKEMKIPLRDFEREEEWWLKDQNMYMDNFSKAGFERLSDNEEMQCGDIIIMQIGAKVPNHAAVYLGNNIMVHHLMNRLSSKDIYGGWYQKCTRCVVRYKGK